MNTDATYVEIIHLSDPHFGDKHVFTAEKTADNRAPAALGMPTLVDKLIEDLIDPAGDPVRPHFGESLGASALPQDLVPPMQQIVCISGDFTQTGVLAEFKQAEALIARLQQTPQLRLPPALGGFFFCPGNHDLKWDSDDDAIRWDQYANFLSRLTGKVHRAQEAALFGGVQVCDAARTVVLSLNTEMKVRSEDGDKSRGDLHPAQLAWARKQLEALSDEAKRTYIKVAMVHHHPVLLPSSAEAGRGYDAISGANQLLPLLHEHGFHVVLHGHKHYPHTFREDVRNAFKQTADHSLFIVAGGTCGSTELPSPKIATQCYNRIRIHWCAKEGTTRVQVVTRGLQTLKANREELMPDQWHWKTLAVDDRHHIARKRPMTPSQAGLRYLPHVDVNSPPNLARVAEYQRVRGHFPVAEILPAMMPGQTAEVHLRIVRHGDRPAPGSTDHLVAVTWSGGWEWFPSVRITELDDPDFRTVFAYWGAALFQAELEFKDGTRVIAHVYVPMLNSQSAAAAEEPQ